MEEKIRGNRPGNSGVVFQTSSPKETHPAFPEVATSLSDKVDS